MNSNTIYEVTKNYRKSFFKLKSLLKHYYLTNKITAEELKKTYPSKDQINKMKLKEFNLHEAIQTYNCIIDKVKNYIKSKKIQGYLLGTRPNCFHY